MVAPAQPHPARRERPATALLAALLVGGLAACRTRAEYVADADREVYEILERRRAELSSEEQPFTIEPRADSLRQRLLTSEMMDAGQLDLVATLAVAAENSRAYQDQREALFLTALDLTLERYAFQVQKVGIAGALLHGDGTGAQDFEADAGFGLSRLLGNGALVVADIGTSLFRNLASGDGWDAITDLGLTITKPLLAGSSSRIVQEPLTQAERNVVYAVRLYQSFRRDFAIDVATRYFRILEAADAIMNEQANFENLTILRERNEALAEAGRLTDVQVDQARQDELRSKNTLIVEQQRYEARLDDFKLFLGLPIEAAFRLDLMDLEHLAASELVDFSLDSEVLADLALEQRLDFLTVLDRVDDSRRRVEVAADDLRARLGLRVDTNASSVEGRPVDFREEDFDWTVGLDLDLPIDRLPERNRYREALINLQASERTAEEEADRIRVAIRESLRDATTTLESYRIQRNAVELNERRVESTNLNLEAGRASTRDILEAQDALVGAQNSATLALINFYLSRLALFRDLELLGIDQTGIRLADDVLAGLGREQP